MKDLHIFSMKSMSGIKNLLVTMVHSMKRRSQRRLPVQQLNFGRAMKSISIRLKRFIIVDGAPVEIGEAEIAPPPVKVGMMVCISVIGCVVSCVNGKV